MSHKRAAAYGADFKKKRTLQKVLLLAIVVVLVSLIPAVYFKLNSYRAGERRELRNSFESALFEIAYNKSGEMLEETPLDFPLLTIHGFSAYELAIAQINSFDILTYINDCIWSLRKAMLLRENSPELHYVLGKAYYYKGSGYADLAVDYLEKAKAASYKADDIPEYLGLAYAAIRDFRSSVAAFTQALTKEPSDLLLLSIARSYLALEENEPGRAYLVRCLETSKDSRTITAARLLLGSVLVNTGDMRGAEAEYLKLIEEDGDNAEAHFQLGELYAADGDPTRARAEWRRALRIDPSHGPARSRLNLL
jgi:tetratricopeptide (TPR) repeat protein